MPNPFSIQISNSMGALKLILEPWYEMYDISKLNLITLEVTVDSNRNDYSKCLEIEYSNQKIIVWCNHPTSAKHGLTGELLVVDYSK